MFWAVWHIDALTQYDKPPKNVPFFISSSRELATTAFFIVLEMFHVLNRGILTLISAPLGDEV